MSTITISLPESMKQFIDAQVTAGGFDSPSDYIAALLREAQVELARAEIDKKLLVGIGALERGEGREMTAADWERLGQRLKAQASQDNGR
ncbi:MAG TPA: hypothetical protein VKI65_16140 [Gemmataceae bacterium]|nr:hypothetical protein [Gemmataceae bacterium]